MLLLCLPQSPVWYLLPLNQGRLSLGLNCVQVGAPRILLTIAQDNLFPVLAWFGITHGVNREPMRGYLLTFVICVACIFVGDLNLVAPLVTGFFMLSCALVNLACFASSYTDSPGWRPRFPYYNLWASFAGFLTCIIFMFLMSWIYSIASTALAWALYK